GSGFRTPAGATQVKFGTVAAGSVSCSSTTSCTATSPAGLGLADVRVTVAGTTSSIVAADQFTYSTSSGAALTSPTPGSTLAGTSGTFSWSSGTNVSTYQLWAGAALGGREYSASADLS